MGLAAELDESPVVDDAVDHGGGHPVVPEHRPPPAEPQVRGDYHRLRLVGVGEGPEEWPRPVRGGREKPELVDDGQAGPADERGLPSSRARLGRITGEDAAKRRASSPLSHAGAQRADATRVLPVPTSPMGAGSDSRPMPSGHDAADQSWPSKVLGAGHSSRTAVVGEHDLPAPATLRASSSLAAIGDRPLQEPVVEMASSSSGALSVSSTVFLTRFLMSLRSDSSSTDAMFADAARAPSSMTCYLAARNHKTGRGPCSAMRLSICERNYASPKLLMSQRSVISGSSATVSRHAWAN